MLKIYTAQYRYSGDDRIDITIKTAKPPWSIFAPTWEMVMDYKRTKNEKAYEIQYNSIVADVFWDHRKELEALIDSDRTITLVCFCRAGEFCHRVLLARHLAAAGATYLGERSK